MPAATLDDHRSFVDRMRAMANAAVLGGIAVLALMLLATVLSVVFATRGAMAANRTVIEVLHFIGAKNGFIAGHFQRHFLRLGLQGGAIGGGSALALFALAEFASRWFLGTAAAQQFTALFGTFSIGIVGLCRGGRAGRPDRRRDRLHLADHGQPDARNHSITVPVKLTERRDAIAQPGFCGYGSMSQDGHEIMRTVVRIPADDQVRTVTVGGAAAPPAAGRAAGRLLRAPRPRHVRALRRRAAAAGARVFLVRLDAADRGVKLDRNADGIVALTGGASRIVDAIELLAAKRGQRLLISGANRATNAAEISRLHPEFASIVRCCVDFDRSAQHARQCDRDAQVGREAQLPLADRGDLRLSHAAGHGGDRPSAPRRDADRVSGVVRKAAVGALVVELRDRAPDRCLNI